ncbi:MAG TPA: GLUG motif-containing protein, partial [Fibrobacteraceae bacterium]|nr:GLUG motif-containing protein [Fibrobacteraceae bacterium]
MKYFFRFGVAFAFLSLAQAQTATKPEGKGTSSDPYQIASLANLYWLSQDSTKWHSNYIQTADIDAAETENWDSGAGFPPIGYQQSACYHPFSGTYNGKGYTIKNLYINTTLRSWPYTINTGLFGTTYGADIDSLNLEDVSIVGLYNTGGLVGSNGAIGEDGDADTTRPSSIFRCSVTGSISGTYNVGGIAGSNLYSTIFGSTFSGTVTASKDSSYVGGVVGYQEGAANHAGSSYTAYIYQCSAAGTVYGGKYFAGGVL